MACRICHNDLPPKSRRMIFSPTFGVLLQVAEILGHMPLEMDDTQHSKYVCAFCFSKLTKMKRIEYDIVHKVAELRTERLSTINLLRKLHTKIERKPMISIQGHVEMEPPQKQVITKILPKPILDHIPVLNSSFIITTPALSEHRKKVLSVPIRSKPPSSSASCNTQQILAKPQSNVRLISIPSKLSDNTNPSQVMKSVEWQTPLNKSTCMTSQHVKSSPVSEVLLKVPHVKQSKIRSGDIQPYRFHSAEKQPYTCGVCGKIFSSSSYLPKHMNIHIRFHSECNVCDKMFNISDNLQRHMRMHTGDKSFKCDVCCKTFYKNSSLKKHMSIHNGVKPCICDICGKMFNRNSSLKTHMLSHTREKPFKCVVCCKMFNSGSKMKIHMRVHTGEKPYICDICSKMFNQSGRLQVHMRIHTGEKPYKCNVCDKLFTLSSHLQRHMKIHTGEKPFKCDICGRMFSLKQPLENHKRIHTGEKPFKCDVCGKMFSENSTLQKHLRIHTGEKPYICDICGKMFNQTGHLYGHMKIHTRKINTCRDKLYKHDDGYQKV